MQSFHYLYDTMDSVRRNNLKEESSRIEILSAQI